MGKPNPTLAAETTEVFNAVAGSAAKLPDAEGLEVPSRGYQMLFDRVPAADGGDEDVLDQLAYSDPGMMDLLIGVLFRYDPP